MRKKQETETKTQQHHVYSPADRAAYTGNPQQEQPPPRAYPMSSQDSYYDCSGMDGEALYTRRQVGKAQPGERSSDDGGRER